MAETTTWNDLSILKKLTGESDEELLSLLLLMAEERLLNLTNRTKMIEQLKPAKRDWAVIAYNRLGMEGEGSRSQGGISTAFVEIPEAIAGVIRATRIARVGGKAHEKAEDQDPALSTETVSSQEAAAGEG